MRWTLLLLLLLPQDDRLKDARHFAYWLQKIDLKQLGDSKYHLCIIDYANEGKEFSKDEIAALRKSKVALAYLSIGEAENYRWYWQKSWGAKKPEWLGPENPDWPGNFKVKYWNEDWQKIVFEYLDKIHAQGFDGCYLDIIDAYAFWAKQEKRSKELMIDFVSKISKRAKEKNKKFLVFVQNAEELVATDAYLAVIDGVGREETWFMESKKNGDASIRETEGWLDKAVKAGKKILAIEYLTDATSSDWVYARAKQKGYVAHVTSRELDSLRINKGHEPD